MSIYVTEPSLLIDAIAQKLKSEFPEVQPPKGSQYWKTAFFKELAPLDTENFWYVRCASLLRKVKKYGPIGVNRLRKFYGGKNRRGPGLNHSARGAGKIIRVALQQLEESKLIAQNERKGRILTPEGTSLLERSAHSILRNKN
ncbi:MAG: 40S ribosomal protein S19 [Candidatus Lokiarchaeota archaeon]|nr:40S ribosomal protein S19 [Candidatus Lokiarchaeota archaeon]